MPVPLVPLALGAGLALWTLYEKQHAKEAQGGARAPVSQVLPPVALAPGAAAFLPPVVAPEPIRNLMANALASNNPAALRATAQNLQALGYGDLAGPLVARATAIESGPVVAAGWFEPETEVPWRTRPGAAGDDLDALVQCAGIGAVHARAGAARAALLDRMRRRAAIGDEVEQLLRGASVGAWRGDFAGHRKAALRGWAQRRGIAGLEPPAVPPPTGVFVGGHPYAHRRREIRRILRRV
jgi:hypothetical protein